MAAPGADEYLPRLYQREIVELATKSNVVAYLDTGAGKTYISVMLLREQHEAAIAAHAAAVAAGIPPPAPWKAVFLAPKVALVEQQATVLARHLPVRVRKLVGADIETWTGQTYVANWRQELAGLDVLVATPQLVVDLLSRGVLPGIHIFDTFVFDEAHHCRGRDPYNQIMEFYRRCNGPKPRIFGMSAAPAGAGAARLHQLPKNLALLQMNMDSQVVTVKDRSEVEAVVPQPKLQLEKYTGGIALLAALPKLAALEHDVIKAITRLDIAVTLAQLRWTSSLEETVGFDGSSGASFVSFEPGAPRFKITRLKDVLRSVLHILHQVGPYGALHSILDAFKWLNAGAPVPKDDVYCSNSSSWRSAKPGTSSVSNSMATPSTEAALRLAEQRTRAAEEGIEWSEVNNLARAAMLSTVDVIAAFASAFAQGGSSRQSGHIAARVAEARRAASENRHLRDAPISVIRQIVESIKPEDLTASLENVATAAAHRHGQLRFGFPLISPKASTLVTVLQRYCTTAASQLQWCGIVFVQQRLAVLALSKLLQELPMCRSWLHVSPFMGEGTALGGLSFHPEDQRSILDQFRAGKLNLLVSTSVAEEGIDVKSCQLVIRFDPAPTAQAFYQSRGRARAAGSELIALLENGNHEEEAAVHEMANYQQKMREAALDNVADLAEGGLEDDQDLMEVQDSTTSSNQVYIVETTGARVSLHSAPSVLNNYVSQLPGDEFILLRPAWRFDYFGAEGSWQQVKATVRLPSSSPVQTAVGELSASKAVAKASAALRACIELHKVGALNDHLLPAALVPEEEDDEEEDVGEDLEEGEVKLKKRSGRSLASIEIRQVAPAALSTPLPRSVDSLTNTVVLIGYGWKKGVTNEWLPMALVLPKAITVVDSLPAVGGANSMGGEWGSATLLGDIVVNAEQLKLVLACNEILRSASGQSWYTSLSNNKTTGGNSIGNGPGQQNDGDQVTYALAPLQIPSTQKRYERSPSILVPNKLDWEMMTRVLWLDGTANEGTSVLEIMTDPQGPGPSALPGTAVITSYNNMMYEYQGIADTLRLSSTFPQDRSTTSADGSTVVQQVERRSSTYSKTGRPQLDKILSPGSTFADFYAQRWGRSDLDPGQPLIQAGKVSKGHDHQQHQLVEQQDSSIYLVPELCRVHPVPLSLWPALAAIPRLLWDIQGGLHAAELLADLQASGLSPAICPPLHLVRQALTAPSAVDSGGDYETLEALGDGLLKFAASTQLFLEHPTWHEGQLTAAKDRLVSNTKLAKVALELELEKRVVILGWSTRGRKGLRRWGQRSSTIGSTIQNQQQKNNTDTGKGAAYDVMDEDKDKDSVEEGEVLGEGDVVQHQVGGGAAEEEEESSEGSTKRNAKLLADVVEALVGAFLLEGGNTAGLALLRHLGLADVPFDATPAAVAPPCEAYKPSVDVAAVEKVLGHRFQRPWLLQEALTHGSVLGHKCYQRLEFLGDAVLDLVLVRKAHSSQPDVSPENLHDIKSATVNAERLALAAVRAGLHTHIEYHSNALFSQMDAFVVEAEAAVRFVQEEAVHNRHGRIDLDLDLDRGRKRILRDGDAWDEVMVRWTFGLDKVCAPKVLSDVAESLIGAVWLDTDGNFDIAWKVAKRLLEPMPWIGFGDEAPVHPLRRIHELAAKMGYKAEFEAVQGDISNGRQSAVRVMFGNLCLGQGPPAQNKKEASRLAAQAVLANRTESDILRMR